ncbi:MAG: hypothetical protein ABJJ53_18165 [Sulfitobacter sp.]
MTYQNTSEPFAARTSSAAFSFLRNATAAFSAGLSAIGASFVAAADKSSRRDQIEALEAKSDAELAAMGIKRDNIAYYVFNDLFYS